MTESSPSRVDKTVHQPRPSWVLTVEPWALVHRSNEALRQRRITAARGAPGATPLSSPSHTLLLREAPLDSARKQQAPSINRTC